MYIGWRGWVAVLANHAVSETQGTAKQVTTIVTNHLGETLHPCCPNKGPQSPTLSVLASQ